MQNSRSGGHMSRSQFPPNMGHNSRTHTMHSEMTGMAAAPQFHHQQQNDDNDLDTDEESTRRRTLFCANLDDRVTEELLYETFLQAGPIESVRIPKDQKGMSRCFGFITYVHECTPVYAMHIYQGLSLFRKPVIVKYMGSSVPPPYRPDPLLAQYYMQQKQSQGGKQKKYDNSSLRKTNYAVCNVESMESESPQKAYRHGHSDWTKGSNQQNDKSSRNLKAPQLSNRQHKKTSPYKMDESRRSGGGNRKDYDHSRDRGRNFSRHFDNQRR